MDGNTHTDDFLAAATSGLKADCELQLDVQAELRSHIEEHRQEAESAGLDSDAAAEQAVRAMGLPAELAAGLEQANRRRMRLRTLVRMAAQWLLAPLAIGVAVLTTDWGTFLAARMVVAIGGTGSLGGTDPALFAYGRLGLTPEQRLILQGDTTRPTRLAQQKAIRDRWPSNRVYLHNYVSHLLAHESELGTTPEQCRAALMAEIAKLQPLDPENARFDYILAGRLLDAAVEIKARRLEGRDGTTKTEYDTLVKDRPKFDEAMAHFRTGLAKTEFRRYSREMAAERLGILGEPTSLREEIANISLVAGILLPDLSHLRNLERATLLYGELLANEGRREEAELFLNAHRRLLPHINGDAFTLIDVLVTGAIAEMAANRVPALYEKLGDPVAAAHARAETARLAAPVKQWKEKRKAADGTASGQARDDLFCRHSGVLAAMFLPALGEYPTPEELAPSRHLEYVVAEALALAVLSVVLFVVMLFSALVALSYRWTRGGRTGALLLLPGGGEVVRMLAYGVLLPLVAYFLVTRGVPWGPRDLNLRFGGPAFLLQLLAMLFAMLGTTLSLAGGFVRRRCHELLLPVAPRPHRFWRIAGWTVIGVLTVPGFLAGALPDRNGQVLEVLSLGGLGLAALAAIVWLVHGVSRHVCFGRRCGAYYGSLARTLIPVVALTLILVNVCSRPYLRLVERQLLVRDTVIGVDPSGGFTVIETRVTQRMRGEIQEACEAE